MKFFIDTANVKEIRDAASLGVVDGVTTNPSLVSKEGRDFKQVITEICSIVDGPISAEAVSLEADKMVIEGTDLAKIHKNVVVKLPMTKEGLKATKILAGKGIRVNMTLVFSPAQPARRQGGRGYVGPLSVGSMTSAMTAWTSFAR
jgi:transaldolase